MECALKFRQSGFSSPWFWYNLVLIFVHFDYWVVCSTRGSFKGSWVSEVGIRATQVVAMAVLLLMLEPLCSQLTWVSLHAPPLPWAIFLHRNPCKILYRSTLYFPPLSTFPPLPSIPGTYMSTGVIKCRVACGAHASALLQRKDFLQEKNDHFQYLCRLPI